MAKKLTKSQITTIQESPSKVSTTMAKPETRPTGSNATMPMLTITPQQYGAYKLKAPFDYPIDDAILNVYNRTGQLLEVLPTPTGPSLEFTVKNGEISIDLEQQLKNYNYLAGEFTVELVAIRNYLGAAQQAKLQIQEISNDRLEIRVVPAFIDVNAIGKTTNSDTIFREYFSIGFFELDKVGVLPNLRLYWTQQDSIKIFDYIQDKFTIQASPYSIIFKLIEPLPSTLSVDDLVWVTQNISEPITENVIVIPQSQAKEKKRIAGPNFDANTKRSLQLSTGYKNWDSVLSYASSSILSTISSQSLVEGIPLNIDYTRFENFIHFGSAYNRLFNFTEKIKKLEYYQDIIDSISTDLNGLANSSLTSSVYYVTQKQTYQNKIDTIKGAFDGFERYLYYESSSYVSNSFGEFLDVAWPKSNSTKPYTLRASTSTQVKNWLTGIYESASVYDQNNPYRLQSLVPSHILEDETNETALVLVDMIGHFFDAQYEYVDHFTKIYNRDQSLTEGFAKDLVYHIAQSLGADFDNGKAFDDLWTYTLGFNSSGSYDNALKLSSEDRTREIWKRIINNLPYLMRTKGTERGLRALINCFGLPSTIVRIREFGGPEPDFDTSSTYDHDRFYYALNVGAGSTTKSGSYIIAQWSGSDGTSTGRFAPTGVELRFKAAPFSGSVRMYNLMTWYTQSFNSTTTYSLPVATLDVGRDSGGDYVQYRPTVNISIPANPLKVYIPSSSNNSTLFDGSWVTTYLTFTSMSYTTYGSPITGSVTSSFTLYAGKKSNYSRVPLIYSASQVYSGSSVDQSTSQSYADYRVATYWGINTPTLTSVLTAKAIIIGSSSAPGGTRVTASFSGSVQELRYWGAQRYVNDSSPRMFSASALLVTSSAPIENSPFYNHIISPTSIVSINRANAAWTGATSSFNDLAYRQTFGTRNVKMDLYTTTSVSGSQPNQNIPWVQPAVFNNFPTTTSSYWTPVVETNYMPWPDVAGNRQISNKIRVDETYLPSDQLYWNVKTEKGLQDSQPTDSPRLGVYLSTADQVNEDIAEQFGGLSLDDYIGDYNDVFESSYDDLEQIQRAYFKKYEWREEARFNSQTYIRLLSNFDGALFSLVKQFVPLRANLQTGLVVEPHILHRPKIASKKPTIEDLSYEALIDIPDQTQTPGGSIQDAAGGGQADYVWDAEIQQQYATPVGNYFEQFEGTVNAETTLTLGGVQNEFNNGQVNEQGSQVSSLYSTADVNYTSYGREKILGSQYDFYTWYKTGSEDRDWNYNRANSKDYWDPIQTTVLDSRKSETMLIADANASYNGTDIYKGSGSFTSATSVTLNTNATNDANRDSSGLLARFGVRVMTETASIQSYYGITATTGGYWQLNTTFDTLAFAVAESIGAQWTGSLNITALAPDADYHSISFTTFKTATAQQTTMSIWYGSSGSTLTPDTIINLSSISSTAPNRASQQVLGSAVGTPDIYFQVQTIVDSTTTRFAHIDNLVVKSYKYAQVQDFHCGDNAAMGQQNQKYNGSKLTSTDWNQDSTDTIDGGPVISIIEGPGVDITVNPSSNGTFTFR